MHFSIYIITGNVLYQMVEQMINGISSTQMLTYLWGCSSRASSSLLLSGGRILPYSSHSAGHQCCLGSSHSAGPGSPARSTEPFHYMHISRLQLNSKQTKKNKVFPIKCSVKTWYWNVFNFDYIMKLHKSFAKLFPNKNVKVGTA